MEGIPSINNRITIVKTFLVAQYIYIGAIIDLMSSDNMEKIQATLNTFIAYNDISNKSNSWIPSEVMHSKIKAGGFNI